jgi:hypothetical protein
MPMCLLAEKARPDTRRRERSHAEQRRPSGVEVFQPSCTPIGWWSRRSADAPCPETWQSHCASSMKSHFTTMGEAPAIALILWVNLSNLFAIIW